MNVEDVGIIESVRDLVIGEISTVHRNFDWQDIGLGVSWNLYFDLGGAQNFAWHRSSEIFRSKSDDSLAAIVLGALKVTTGDDGLLVVRALDWAVFWCDSLDNGSVVVEVTVRLLCGNH